MTIENEHNMPGATPPLTDAGDNVTVSRKSLSGILKAGRSKDRTVVEDVKMLTPELPAELIGGQIPHVAGREDEMVWNAAAQACGTERVHFCYSIDEGKIFYLALPSAAMASIPDSWCPLAAALPGHSEYYDKDTIYIYEKNGSASALRWDPDTGRMQVFLGAARTIMPRIQSMDASFVTINSDVAKPIAWKNRALRQEELSRALTKWLFLSGLAVALLSIFYWFASFTMANIFTPNLKEAKELTQNAALSLMKEASSANRSNLSKHISRINKLSIDLTEIGGRLLRYELLEDGEKAEWEALVPRALQGDLSRLGARAKGIDEKEQGYLRIVGK